MRDSRLGSYGAIALALALMLRVTSLAALTERGLGLAIFALICAGAVSRTAGLLPLLLSAPARRDGAGAAMPRPAGDAPRLALILAGAASAPLLLAGLSVGQVACADIAAALAAFAVTQLAKRQIGGYTGDVLGAAQQAAEIAVLLALWREMSLPYSAAAVSIRAIAPRTSSTAASRTSTPAPGRTASAARRRR